MCLRFVCLERVLVFVAMAASTTTGLAAERPNVLLICIDDLRPELGCYGAGHIHSPAIDRLAAESRRFDRHYVQAAVCGPSRCSLLTGQRWWHWDCWREVRREANEPQQPTSFAHHFRRNGYRTISIGKISHEPGGTMPPAYEVHQVPFSWDEAFCPNGHWKNPWQAFFAYDKGQAYNKVIRWTRDQPPRLPLEAADVDDLGYADGWIAKSAVKQLKELADQPKPFLLAVGFFKPHLPHNAPKKYWDLYDRDAIELPSWTQPPLGVDPTVSLHESFELTTHYQWPSGPGNISEQEAKRQRHAYFACVSYVDAQVGKVLDAYRQLGLEENTVVVLWADHGWHLFDHGMFGKQTNFEVATRSPLIIRIPDMKQVGQGTNALVETVDLYPTLVDLCDLPAVDQLAGRSLRPILDDPSRPGKDVAFSFHNRGKHVMGRTLRDDRWRLVEWKHEETGERVQIELYDHRIDSAETRNVASENPDVVEQLLDRLNDPNLVIRR